MSLRFSTILFDLDGTLVDSVIGIHQAASVAAESVGGPDPDLDFVRDAIGRGVHRLIHRVGSGRQDGEIDEIRHATALAAFQVAYADSCLGGTVLREGVASVLTLLRSEGRHLIVATNKPRDPASLVLHRLGLDSMVDGLVCPEDAGVVKPDPIFVDRCLGRTSRGEALLVGDSSIDGATALATNLPFIAIRGGYDEGRDIGDLDPSPDRVVDSPVGVPAAIRSLERDLDTGKTTSAPDGSRGG